MSNFLAQPLGLCERCAMVAAPSILETRSSRAAHTPTLGELPNWLVGWSQRGWLAITLPTATADVSFERWITLSVDRELSDLGAGPRPSYVEPSARAILEDQIYRAKMLGFQGLALQLPSLAPFAPHGVLSPEDSQGLIAWCKAAVELDAPVKLESDDSHLRIFMAPVALIDAPELQFPIVSAPNPVHSRFNLVTVNAPQPEVAPDSDVHASAATVSSSQDQRVSAVQALAPAPLAHVSRRAAMRSLLEDDDSEIDSLETLRESVQSDVRAADFAETAAADVESCEPAPSIADDDDDAGLMALRHATTDFEHPVAPREESAAAESVSSPSVASEQLAPSDLVTEPSTLEALCPTSALDDYSEHVENLQSTGGSHGWEGIEQMFETHYLPLQKAVREGTAPVLAAAILAEWAKDFSESYERAFDAIRNNRGKRPRLVLDVPSYAFQLSRKHNAEHLKLVLVDAMRADIGPIVRDKLRLQMANTAECVASGLLWSALPADTSAQMELIARGTDGLRHFSGELTEAQLMSRGNDLRRLRPVRVGSHRMYKLDIVQYLARDAQRHTSDNLEQYAAEVATSVGRFLRQQEPGTLVYVFGDHGFGGAFNAAPEQILTSYQAWLISN